MLNIKELCKCAYMKRQFQFYFWILRIGDIIYNGVLNILGLFKTIFHLMPGDLIIVNSDIILSPYYVLILDN